MLYQNDAEMLFPARVIPLLRNLRGEEWKQLIDRVSRKPENDPDVLALSLMMIRLNGCMTCNADSYRALRGCTQCAQHTVARFKGADSDLIDRWNKARNEVIAYLTSGAAPQEAAVSAL